MKEFLIITHVVHKRDNNKFLGYAPYIREMNLWLKYVDNVTVVAPLNDEKISNIDLAYDHKNLRFVKIPEIAFISVKKALEGLFMLPLILYKIFKACRKADHIHLRCPGNIGLLGCLVQILFPSKVKTAKYAGNWDPGSKQPLSYRFQKWILESTFLTKNIKVLVYGSWKNQSKNIKPFFTATYFKEEIEKFVKKEYSGNLNFVFVGSLVEGKRPLLTVKIVEFLNKQGLNGSLNIYGDGVLKNKLEVYITNAGLENDVKLHGNKSKEDIKEALKAAHFLILPSKSEGWPKAVAEAMFFGAIPIATKISCVPYMLDLGNRGILIDPEVKLATNTIMRYLEKGDDLQNLSRLAMEWSQKYTLNFFESEVKKLIVS